MDSSTLIGALSLVIATVILNTVSAIFTPSFDADTKKKIRWGFFGGIAKSSLEILKMSAFVLWVFQPTNYNNCIFFGLTVAASVMIAEYLKALEYETINIKIDKLNSSITKQFEKLSVLGSGLEKPSPAINKDEGKNS